MPSKKKVVEAKPVCKAKIIYVVQEFEGWTIDEDELLDEDNWYNRTHMQRIGSKNRWIGDEVYTLFRTKDTAQKYADKLKRSEGGHFRVSELVLV